MGQQKDAIIGSSGIIFNWGEYLGKRSTYLLKHMGITGMTVYPQRGADLANDNVVFDYADRDVLFFIRGNLVVEIRFLQKHDSPIFKFKMGMTREEVEKAAGKPNKIMRAAEIGFQQPFDQVFVYNDLDVFDFTIEVIFDKSWNVIQLNIYP